MSAEHFGDVLAILGVMSIGRHCDEVLISGGVRDSRNQEEWHMRRVTCSYGPVAYGSPCAGLPVHVVWYTLV